jgi:hypothetical protein
MWDGVSTKIKEQKRGKEESQADVFFCELALGGRRQEGVGRMRRGRGRGGRWRVKRLVVEGGIS